MSEGHEREAGGIVQGTQFRKKMQRIKQINEVQNFKQKMAEMIYIKNKN